MCMNFLLHTRGEECEATNGANDRLSLQNRQSHNNNGTVYVNICTEIYHLVDCGQHIMYFSQDVYQFFFVISHQNKTPMCVGNR